MSNNVSNIKQMQSITQGDKKNILLQTNKTNINATNVNVVASPTIAASALSTQLISNRPGKSINYLNNIIIIENTGNKVKCLLAITKFYL